MQSIVNRLLDDLSSGPIDRTSRISEEEAIQLYEEADLTTIRNLADIDRRARHGIHTTYLVDRNVNYTNVCTINCQFCSFYRPPGDPDTYLQSIDQISARISELEGIGGSRVLMQGGVHPELPIEWYEELLMELRRRHPGIALDVFSPIEIEGIAEICDLPTIEVLRRLSAAGMHGLPGGGAEMLVDSVRLDISPKKGSADNWLRVMGEAQSLGLTTSATNVIGFGETSSDRVRHMARIREMQDSAIDQGWSGFTSFISWPVQLEHNSFGRRNRGRNRIELGVTAVEYLKHVAISRLFLDSIDHIQASWPTMGLDIAQLALAGGADDIGSTMMEENVVSASGTTRVKTSEAELQQTILRAGSTPIKRDSDYRHLETPDMGIDVRSLPSPPAPL